ncbi:MAG: ABC transporter ATP-binding protein [Verrucomicrobia bacterium]|nr:ABC transporter ATP-binding protein [Verrucomicrobiota bacterium]
MAEVQLRRVCKQFGRVEAVRGIDLVIPDGAYVCLVGPSGCGKTTLLRCIAGLEAIDAGEILIGGHRAEALEPFARNIGLAFQNYALYPHLDVRGNLAFSLRAPRYRAQYSNKEIEKRVNSMAALLQIEGLMDKSVVALSGGQKERVALGRALIRNPGVLLLDEPLTHLDARLRYEMRVELKLLQRRLATTTVHVTHDQLEAQALGDLVVVMRQGLVEQAGAPEELCNHPATSFVASFVGDPPMSVLRARLERKTDGLSLRLGETRLQPGQRLTNLLERFHGQDVEIAVRAHDISLGSAGDSQCILAKVQVHEWVGHELQIVVTFDGSTVRLRTQQRLALSVGDEILIRLNLEHARIFDPKTHGALGARTMA